ncbi:MAG: tetratricopeptide repeat protein [Treponema sp.]|jgi:tetratricopeptide (TPR) repeat protein|nr:tetratricopeptide repeat protein [Treponema sp.]
MKKILTFLVLAAMTVTASVGALSFDEGIARIARDIESELPMGTRIAVATFESPSAKFSDYVLEELQGVLVNNRRLVVTERSRLELLRKELEFHMSGYVSDERAASLGKYLGAQALVTGSLTELGGGNYRCRFNAIDVETAVRKASSVVTIQRDNVMAFMLPTETITTLAQVPSKLDPALAAVYFNAGFTHYESGRYTEAVADFTRTLEVKTDDEASLRYRVYSYYYLKDYDGSVTDASRLIQLEPKNEGNYNIRGAAYQGKGDYDRAIGDYDQALRLNPNDANTYYGRGLAYYYKRDYVRARADFENALRLNSNANVQELLEWLRGMGY